MKHTVETLKVLEQAFGPPVYAGDLSHARLKDRGSLDLLRRARGILEGGAGEPDGEAFRHFMLAVIDRYLPEGRGRYGSHLETALRCDPNFLEAAIALRDGDDYLDPFCYVNWESLRESSAGARPFILEAPGPNLCRLELVRHEGLLIPAVFVKHQRKLFRSLLTTDTAVKVLVSAEAVMPAMSLLIQVVPVIFDDDSDPYWCANYLNPFAVADTEFEGIPVLAPVDYRPRAGRDLARRFCLEPPRCALFVLDEKNRMLVSRLVSFAEEEAEGLREMGRVLHALGERSVSYSVWKNATELHLNIFSRKIQSPAGRPLLIPKGRSTLVAQKLIHEVTVRNGGLILKGSAEAFAAHEQDRAHDVFLSHAHEENVWAREVAAWLRSVWPSLRVYHTNPGEQERFNKDPFFFHREMLRSRCVVVLSTPLSIEKPWVGVEQGAAAASGSVIYLLTGGVSPDDLRRLAEKDPYARVDYNKVVSVEEHGGWATFARLLAQELHLTPHGKLPALPRHKPGTVAADTRENLSAQFVGELIWQIAMPERQTEQEAEALLAEVEAEFAGKNVLIAGAMRLSSRWPARRRFACLLLTMEDESVLAQLLDSFPALTDNGLLAELQRLRRGTNDRHILAREARLSRLILERIAVGEFIQLQGETPRESFLKRAKEAVLRRARRLRR